MNRLRFTPWLIAMVAMVAASGLAFRELRRHHDYTAAELASAQAKRAETQRLRQESKRLRDLETLSRSTEREAQAALRSELDAARREVDALEAKARQTHDEAAVAAREKMDFLQHNHDLAKGAVLIDNCTDQGRGTPEATLQTLVWAAAHGHDDIVRGGLAFEGPARAAAEAAIALLPASTQAQYPDPEALGALFVDHAINDLTAIRIVDRSQPSPDTTVLKLAGLQKNLGEVTFKQGADGWRVFIDTPGFERIRRNILNPPRR